MKIRTMGRHIRDAFKSLFRNGLMTFGAVSAVSMILLTYVYLLIWQLTKQKQMN